jgi:hypothetical protein
MTESGQNLLFGAPRPAMLYRTTQYGTIPIEAGASCDGKDTLQKRNQYKISCLDTVKTTSFDQSWMLLLRSVFVIGMVESIYIFVSANCDPKP